MKKTALSLLILAMILSMTACGSGQESASQPESSLSTETAESSPAETVQQQTAAPAKLTNKMTELELDSVKQHALTLLDEPEKPNADPNAEHKVSIVIHTLDTKEWRATLAEHRDEITDAEYNKAMKRIQKAEAEGVDYSYPSRALVDGYIISQPLPNADEFDDGGSFTFCANVIGENGEWEVKDLSFDSFEGYLDFIREQDAAQGYTQEEIGLDILYMQLAYDALKTGDYETLSEDSIDASDSSLYLWSCFHNFRSEWEYDREAMEAIKDSVCEISIYDEELGRQFIVHVTLPPNYDKDKTYPVFFLTDGIWRFGNCPELRKCMENGEAAPVILVSIWYNYDTSYGDGYLRDEDLVTNRGKMLDFVTDNLMPYLCENYNIDCADSTLYGHSSGGVFTHYALFNSDRYENQPFGHFIIGSPAFWGLYNDNDRANISNDDVLNDYGYFDRNQTLDKTVFLCAGSQEDPDYADRYNGHDTTLEGTAKLKERLEAHGADLTYKLYDSHHYQFIPEMLTEYLKAVYPS